MCMCVYIYILFNLFRATRYFQLTLAKNSRHHAFVALTLKFTEEHALIFGVFQ